jgi:hypothetical protein
MVLSRFFYDLNDSFDSFFTKWTALLLAYAFIAAGAESIVFAGLENY